jgi:hypothetical protein
MSLRAFWLLEDFYDSFRLGIFIGDGMFDTGRV